MSGFNISELVQALGAGGTLVQMAQGADKKKRADQAARFNEAINYLDSAISTADNAYTQVIGGAVVDYDTIYRRVGSELEAAQAALAPIRAAALVPGLSGLEKLAARRRRQGLGFGAPMGPAFGPAMMAGGGGGGAFMVNNPQGFTPHPGPGPGVPGSVARSMAPQFAQLRALLRGIRQRLAKARDALERPHPMSGLGDSEDGAHTNMVFLATLVASTYHGYKRSGPVWAALWAAPTLLSGSKWVGIAMTGIALAQGFGKPAGPAVQQQPLDVEPLADAIRSRAD